VPVSGLVTTVSALLLITSLAALLTVRLQLSRRWIAVPVLFGLSVLLPTPGLSIWLWIKGAAGELSIVTLVLLAGYLLRRLAEVSLLHESTRKQLYGIVLIAGLLLYPATLGLTAYDPYRIGFTPWLDVILLVLVIVYWLLQRQQVALVLLAVVAANELGVLASINTWDYLLDPLVWLASPVLLGKLLIQDRKAARAAGSGHS
jgi:hypothetical protein